MKPNPDFNDVQTNGKIIKNASFENIEKFIKKMRTEWGVSSICDIVLNHTANESEWLQEHPDATYSCFTMPHLRPAFLLDVVFGLVTRDVMNGYLENVGVLTLVENEDHIQALRHHIHTTYLSKANLAQFYQCDIEKYVTLFSEKVLNYSTFFSFFLPIFRIIILSFFFSLDSYWTSTNCFKSSASR